MILSKTYYEKISAAKSLWIKKQMKRFSSENIYKTLSLQKTEWPDKFYYYSPRLKSKPRFTGDVAKLSQWNEAKECEMICPTLAITVTKNEILIDEKGCITCGLCLEFAPPGILEAPQKDWTHA